MPRPTEAEAIAELTAFYSNMEFRESPRRFFLEMNHLLQETFGLEPYPAYHLVNKVFDASEYARGFEDAAHRAWAVIEPQLT